MTTDRVRKLEIRAAMASTGLTFNEAAAVVGSRRVPDAGNPAPDGVPMAPDPLGLAEDAELFTAPLMVDTMLPPGPKGLQAAQLIADAVDYLIDPAEGWYRARAQVYGPQPTRESGMAPLAGHKPGMLLVQVSARRRWTTTGNVHTFLEAAATAILAALTGHYPQITQRHITVQAIQMSSAQQILAGEEEPTARTDRSHPALHTASPFDGEEQEDGQARYAFRVVDGHDRGWFAVGPVLYSCTGAAQRDVTPMTLDELDAQRGPLREVAPAPQEDLDRLAAAFLDAGPKAVASLLVALRRLARQHAEAEYERSGRMHSGRLYAGGEDSWESVAMRSLTWGLGVDMSDQPKRLHETTVATVREVIDQWVSPASAVYVEVAQNLSSAFQAAARAAGGWSALADQHFELGHRFAHSENAVAAAHAWLMGQPLLVEAEDLAEVPGPPLPARGE